MKVDVPLPLNIIVTGGAGRIAYSLIPLLLDGSIFADRLINLHLFGTERSADRLLGVKMEIEDSNFPFLNKLVATTKAVEAFMDADVAVLLGGVSKIPGKAVQDIHRSDFIDFNTECIREQAIALNSFAKRSVKVLVVVNPCNTLCLVAMRCAPRIPASNFSCLTRLDEERLRSICAGKLSECLQTSVRCQDAKDVFILGNHSATQVALLDFGYAELADGTKVTLAESILKPDCGSHTAAAAAAGLNTESCRTEILHQVQKRGHAVFMVAKSSSALSCARSIALHLRDWLAPFLSPRSTTTFPPTPTLPTSRVFSMGLLDNNNLYGVPQDLVFSYPCRRVTSPATGGGGGGNGKSEDAMERETGEEEAKEKGEKKDEGNGREDGVEREWGRVEVVRDFAPTDAYTQELVRVTCKELMEERTQALEILVRLEEACRVDR